MSFDVFSAEQVQKMLSRTSAVIDERINTSESNTDKRFQNAIDSVKVVIIKPNLLVNWYFADPINQRGKQHYVGTAFMIDRWATYDYKQVSLTIKKKSYTSISFLDPDLTIFGQVVENPEFYMNKTLTFSVLTADGELYSSTTTLKSKGVTVDEDHVYINDDCWINIFYAGDNNILFARFVSNKQTEIKIVAAKLELGSIQTLAHKEDNTWILNDPSPDPTLELMKCQRYLQPIIIDSEQTSSYVDRKQITITRQLPVRMRANPTLLNPDCVRYIEFDGGGWYNVKNVVVNTIDNYFIYVQATLPDNYDGDIKLAKLSSINDTYDKIGPLWLSSE